MCLAIPSKIINIDDMIATIDVYGARREINLMLLPEPVTIGDFVLVHAGFAIQKVSEEVAEDSLKLVREVIESIDDHLDEPAN